MMLAVVGLGYVGLPLAVAFGKQQTIIGFDLNKERIEQLKKWNDSNGDIDTQSLKETNVKFTSDPSSLMEADFIIVAVPTPINKNKEPDLSYVKSASNLVGKNLKRGAIVVFESTVFPGATEDICVPIINNASGFECGKDWMIGYSPERINPGDKDHTVEKIVKVVAGMDQATTDTIAEIYDSVIKAGTYKARDIKTAEAAKVIENIQRDLNIALMNELSIIFQKMDINTKDVIDAAATKWNFHRYSPGLVGGHCIGVDPYYLTYRAKQLGLNPNVILGGRAVNDAMHEVIADRLELLLSVHAKKKLKGSKVLVLGLTFKENVSDYRNSRIINLVSSLKEHGADVLCNDPLLGKNIIEKNFCFKYTSLEKLEGIDAVIIGSPHDVFRDINLDKLFNSMRTPILFEVKNFFGREKAESVGFIYATL